MKSIRLDQCVAEVGVGVAAPAPVNKAEEPTVPRAHNDPGGATRIFSACVTAGGSEKEQRDGERGNGTERQASAHTPPPPPRHSPDRRPHSGFLHTANWIHRSLDKVHD